MDYHHYYNKYSSIRQLLIKKKKLSVLYLLNKEISFISYERTNVKNKSLKEIFGSFFKAWNFPELGNFLQQSVLVTTVNTRSHYLLLIKNAISHYQNVKIYDYKNVWIGRHISINNIINAFSLFFAFCRDLPNGWNKRELFYLASEYCCYLNSVDILNSQYAKKIDAEKLIAFDANFGFDALMVYFFKSIGRSTFSLQHSYNFEFKNFFPEEIIKYDVNYPDFYLTWSNLQKDTLVKKFNARPENIIVAGYPYLFEKIKEVKTTFTKGLVLLSRFYYHSGNIKLLNELKKIQGVNFTIRPHPSLMQIPEKIDFSDYEILCETAGFKLDIETSPLQEILNESDFDFCISYHTAAYFDCYSKGLICFRYIFEENEYAKGLDDKFKDSNELLQLMNKKANTKSEILVDEINQMLIFELGAEINNYQNLI